MRTSEADDKYEAGDDDVPEILSDAPREKNRIQIAQRKLLGMANELGVMLTFAEVQKFAVVLVGMEQDAERTGRAR